MDLNADGWLDLAVASQRATARGMVHVLVNQGSGTFADAVAYEVGGAPRALATGDLTGDGIVDLVTVSDEPGTATVLVGLGDGTYQTARLYAAGPSPVALALADYDVDGRLDLAAADTEHDMVGVLMNQGVVCGYGGP